MKYKPYEYQEFAYNHILKNTSSGIFLDMGLGKTVITLTAINALLYDYFDVSKVLVIAPLWVAANVWGTEIAKWDHLKHLKLSKILGPEKDRIAALNVEADIYIINRENIMWLIEQHLTDWPFDMLIVDELSSFKSAKVKRFKALRKVLPYFKRIVGLTGTPAPNGLIDLWPQLYLLDHGQRLGNTITGYKSRYFESKGYIRNSKGGLITSAWAPRPEAEKNIYEKIEDICISMKSKDWLELPDKISRTIDVKLAPEDRKKYKILEREFILELVNAESIIVADTAAILANKLLQLSNGAVYDVFHKPQVIHNAKLLALEEVIEELNGNPVIVFYAYRHDRDRIIERFPEARAFASVCDLNDWNDGKISILLAHPASAGHGLNLQAGGHNIVWFGLPWSLELYLQANARLHRQGQLNNVFIHHLVTEDTVDEDVMCALARKEKGQEALLRAVKARIGRIVKGD